MCWYNSGCLYIWDFQDLFSCKDINILVINWEWWNTDGNSGKHCYESNAANTDGDWRSNDFIYPLSGSDNLPECLFDALPLLFLHRQCQHSALVALITPLSSTPAHLSSRICSHPHAEVTSLSHKSDPVCAAAAPPQHQSHSEPKPSFILFPVFLIRKQPLSCSVFVKASCTFGQNGEFKSLTDVPEVGWSSNMKIIITAGTSGCNTRWHKIL